MSWLQRFEDWLNLQSQKLILRGAISICNRIIRMQNDIDYLEWTDMAKLAYEVRPKIAKELKELTHGRNYYQG